jgi:replication factor C subunit 3/5
MSDFEDEMDVDVPATADKAIKFGGETSKGKRSAANLPVEAEDSLPWYELLPCSAKASLTIY